MRPLDLEILPETLALCRFGPTAGLPAWALEGELTSHTRTPEELSVICRDASVPAGVAANRGWRAIRVAGKLDFALTGVLVSLAAPLAEAGVSILAVSTHDTDYVLVKDDALGRAVEALTAAGHRFFEYKP